MKQNRTKRITIRFTESEYKALKEKYRATTSRQISDYIRKILQGKPVTVKVRNQSMDDFIQQLVKTRNDLNAVGNNFNQVVKKINSIQDERLTSTWLPYAQTLQKELLEKIAGIQQRINIFSKEWLQK